MGHIYGTDTSWAECSRPFSHCSLRHQRRLLCCLHRVYRSTKTRTPNWIHVQRRKYIILYMLRHQSRNHFFGANTNKFWGKNWKWIQQKFSIAWYWSWKMTALTVLFSAYNEHSLMYYTHFLQDLDGVHPLQDCMVVCWHLSFRWGAKQYLKKEQQHTRFPCLLKNDPCLPWEYLPPLRQRISQWCSFCWSLWSFINFDRWSLHIQRSKSSGGGEDWRAFHQTVKCFHWHILWLMKKFAIEFVNHGNEHIPVQCLDQWNKEKYFWYRGRHNNQRQEQATNTPFTIGASW